MLLMDGATENVNPVESLIAEARAQGYTPENIFVLSIGAGRNEFSTKLQELNLLIDLLFKYQEKCIFRINKMINSLNHIKY